MDIKELTQQFGKGAIQTPPEIATTRFRLAAPIPRVIDWQKGYSVENGFNLYQRDQDGSSSCTAQATSYYNEALEQVENRKDERYSARFIYSQVFIPPDGGAYIWKAMAIPLKTGAAGAQSVPDGVSDENTMQDASLNQNALLEAKFDKYAAIPRGGIDHMAQIVEDYHGFVTGFNGHDGMFEADGMAKVFTELPQWGHAVFVCGYKMHNGKKCLIFKNSWSAQWGDDGYGYFPEEFVNSGLMFDAYVYAAIEDLDPTSMMSYFEAVQIEGSEEVYLVRDGKRTHFYNEGAFALVYDWSKIKKVTQAELDAIPDSGLELAALVKK